MILRVLLLTSVLLGPTPTLAVYHCGTQHCKSCEPDGDSCWEKLKDDLDWDKDMEDLKECPSSLRSDGYLAIGYFKPGPGSDCSGCPWLKTGHAIRRYLKRCMPKHDVEACWVKMPSGCNNKVHSLKSFQAGYQPEVEFADHYDIEKIRCISERPDDWNRWCGKNDAVTWWGTGLEVSSGWIVYKDSICISIIPGAEVTEYSGSTVDACKAKCTQDSSCTRFHFYKHKNICSLMSVGLNIGASVDGVTCYVKIPGLQPKSGSYELVASSSDPLPKVSLLPVLVVALLPALLNDAALLGR